MWTKPGLKNGPVQEKCHCGEKKKGEITAFTTFTPNRNSNGVESTNTPCTRITFSAPSDPHGNWRITLCALEMPRALVFHFSHCVQGSVHVSPAALFTFIFPSGFSLLGLLQGKFWSPSVQWNQFSIAYRFSARK